MAKYNILIKPSAAKALKRIPQKYIQKIVQKIQSLADNPRPSGCEKLTNQEKYRVRQGRCRIIYMIEDDPLIVTVVKIGRRRNVYN